METQKCKNCRIERALSYFKCQVFGKDGNPNQYAKECFICKDPSYDPLKKICSDCGERKLLTEFTGKIKKSHCCKTCEKKEYQEKKEYNKLHRNLSETGEFRGNICRLLKCFYSINGVTFLEKTGKVPWSNKLPYSVAEFRNHVESQMESWMTWDNWGEHNSKKHDLAPTWQLYGINDRESFSNVYDYWNFSNIVVSNSIKTVEDGLRKKVTEETRVCIDCGEEKDMKHFYRITYSKKCNSCRNKDKKINRSENPEKYKEIDKRKYEKRKNDINKKSRERRAEDPCFKLRWYMSNKVRSACNKNGSLPEYLPYSIEELKKHIENQFEPWMTWENWGSYNPKTHDKDPSWQLDHVIPHSSFKYESMDSPEFLACWALSNLRPLDAKINILESSRGINGRGKIINPTLFKKEDCSVKITDINELITFKEVK